MKRLLYVRYIGVGLEGGDCPSLTSSASISVSFLRNASSLSSVSMCWYALTASFFCVARNRPYKMSAILMGAFLSASPHRHPSVAHPCTRCHSDHCIDLNSCSWHVPSQARPSHCFLIVYDTISPHPQPRHSNF